VLKIIQYAGMCARPLSRLEGVSRLRILRSLYMWFGSSAEFRLPDTFRVHLLSFMYFFIFCAACGIKQEASTRLPARGELTHNGRNNGARDGGSAYG
jgi:hypothetical protein